MEAFLASIILFAGNFAPRGWAFCAGQILPIAQNTALFSLLGTTYGGNGQTTFALPDLRGRVPVGTGQGPGLSAVDLGEVAGTPTHTLLLTEMPTHNHLMNAFSDPGNVGVPTGAYLAGTGGLDPEYRTSGTTAVQLNAQAISIAGGNQPHNNMQPYLGMNYIIALEGIFPSRN